MANRALRVGDQVTFRDGAIERLRTGYPWLPTEERWLAARGCTMQIDQRAFYLQCGRKRPLVSVRCSWSMNGFAAFAADMRLDDRPRRWRFHDQLEAEQLAARDERAKRCPKRKTTKKPKMNQGGPTK